MKHRNPTWGCPQIAEQINLAFGTSNKDGSGILALRYRPVPTEVGSLQANGIAHMKDSLWSLGTFDVNRKTALAWAGKKSD